MVKKKSKGGDLLNDEITTEKNVNESSAIPDENENFNSCKMMNAIPKLFDDSEKQEKIESAIGHITEFLLILKDLAPYNWFNYRNVTLCMKLAIVQLECEGLLFEKKTPSYHRLYKKFYCVLRNHFSWKECSENYCVAESVYDCPENHFRIPHWSA